jgi:FkbM family methyltransferase
VRGRPRLTLALLLLVCLVTAVYLTRIYRIPKTYAMWWTGLSRCEPAQLMEFPAETAEFTRAIDTIESGTSQIGSDGELKLFHTAYGDWWSGSNNVAFLLAEQKSGFYRREGHFVRKGDVVLDCGANIGTFTREALDAGARHVVAIEPGPVQVACLRRNFAREIAEGRVTIYPKGVWDRDDTLSMWVHDAGGAIDSFVLKERQEDGRRAPREIRLPVTTIDKAVRELGLATVDFIKMDIEGAERNALRGASETLQRHRPRMAIASENLPDDDRVLPAVVASIRGDYAVSSGECRYEGRWHARPHVLFFQ